MPFKIIYQISNFPSDSLDDAVCRELLGKKLSSKYRKDLDEISEKTTIKLKSCRRQFDNIKRITKSIEEAQGSFLKIIQREFLLSEEVRIVSSEELQKLFDKEGSKKEFVLISGISPSFL